MDRIDGGPAFPTMTKEWMYDSQSLQRGTGDFPGMSLRDWFAGLALQGLLASLAGMDTELRPEPDALASASNELADAMLEARKCWVERF